MTDSVKPASPFDEKAATWDDEPKRARAEAVAAAIRETVPLERSMRLLEYGAGTGLVTQALRDSVGSVTLADTSAGMRDVMEDKIASGALTDARVWSLDLASDPVPDDRFELIATVMVMHHIEDVESVLAKFAELLVEGGHLCIVDLVEEDGSFHAEDFGGHHGFAESWLTERLAAAGFSSITFDHCHQIERENRTYPLFLATAVR